MKNWIKNNKLAAFLLLIISLWLVNNWLVKPFFGTSLLRLPGAQQYSVSDEMAPAMGLGGGVTSGLRMPIIPPSREAAPQLQIKDRLVIQESYLSLLVKNVMQVRKNILDYTTQAGGYMVSSQVSNPQDAPTATIVVRMPSSTLEQALDYLRGLAVKVVSENLQGTDVTDEYVDVEARIALLEKTKARLEAILNEAREISDITNLNQQIINTQSQIDSLKGQQQAMAKNAENAKLTIYLSTDEIALPYAPSETFRPNVIFKTAVRSLISNLRKVATVSIWLIVYAVIWVPIVVLIWWLKKRQIKP